MITVGGGQFRDEHGRRLLLRGVNLGGSSKVPSTPDGATWRREGFFDHRHVSFVGRPFPLEAADEHFGRLRRWGLTTLRLLTTWEAIEHAGPGVYDRDYLDYFEAVVRKAGEHGLRLFVDPHQDVWSRFTGGDGAPGWTLEAAGFDMTCFDETGAAITHAVHGDPFPRMIWPTNNDKLAAATMFTLFFGGDDFAPGARVDGEPIQGYLQRHYLASIQQLASRLAGLDGVIGYDTLNEPGRGYIGRRDLGALEGVLRLGEMPTPFQSMLLGAGLEQTVEVWRFGLTGPRRSGQRALNAGGARAWLPGRECLWREHGVWDLGADGAPRLLRPDHFSRVQGRVVDFNRDYLRPFVNRYAASVRAADRQALIFVEGVPDSPLPTWGPEDAGRIVSAPHWYDGLVLLLKRFDAWVGADAEAGRLVLGPRAIRRAYAAQIRRLQQHARAAMAGAPTLIGEVGIPFDVHGKRAYRTGDFRAAIRAMDRSLRAMDDALASYTLWNYTADNTNARGDQWNDEDLSIFSRDQQADPADPDSGGRALEAAVRPYARAVAGELRRMHFDVRTRRFEIEFAHDPAVSAPTEVFVPAHQYPNGFEVEISDGRWEAEAREQLLCYVHTPERAEHRLRVRPRAGR